MNDEIVSILSALESLEATEFYIGLSSNAAGEFSYVNGTCFWKQVMGCRLNLNLTIQ